MANKRSRSGPHSEINNLPRAQFRKPVAPCIYCGSTEKPSDEHLFAKWMKPFLSAGTTKSIHRTQKLSTVGPIDTVKVGKLHRPGDPRGNTLRVVCKQCNETWLGQIQEHEAKPVLGPLLIGKFKPLHRRDLMALVRWAMMYTFVAEHMNPTMLAIPQGERAYFRFSRMPSANWRVYASAYAPPPNGVGPMFLRPATVDLVTPDELQRDLPWDTFLLTVAPNQMFFQAVYSHSHVVSADMLANLDHIAELLGLVRIWPLPAGTVELDHHRVRFEHHQYFINVFHRALRSPGTSAAHVIYAEHLDPMPRIKPDLTPHKANGRPL